MRGLVRSFIINILSRALQKSRDSDSWGVSGQEVISIKNNGSQLPSKV